MNPVAELDDQGNLVSLFIYGTKSHVPDGMIKNGVRYLFVTDQVGSVRLVVDAATGAVAQQIDYDAFGNVTFDSTPGFQPFAFAGGLYDGQTKLVRFGARDYDPEVGRWTAKDPRLFDDGSNLYTYAANDPVNAYDPTGLRTVGECVTDLAGAALSCAGAAAFPSPLSVGACIFGAAVFTTCINKCPPPPPGCESINEGLGRACKVKCPEEEEAECKPTGGSGGGSSGGPSTPGSS